MSKHLKVRAELCEDKKQFRLRIIEQTHVDKEFGGGQAKYNKNASPWAFIHGPVALVSWYMIRYQELDRGTFDAWELPKGIKIMVRVGHPKLGFYGPNEGTIESKWWPEIKKAVEAYNEFYG